MRNEKKGWGKNILECGKERKMRKKKNERQEIWDKGKRIKRWEEKRK